MHREVLRSVQLRSPGSVPSRLPDLLVVPFVANEPGTELLGIRFVPACADLAKLIEPLLQPADPLVHRETHQLFRCGHRAFGIVDETTFDLLPRQAWRPRLRVRILAGISSVSR